MKTPVLIIDDVHEEVVAIEEAIGNEEGFSCIYADWADKGETILETIRQNLHSVVLLDIFFRGIEEGENIYRAIKEVNPYIPILILTNNDDFPVFKKYSDMGAINYIYKNESVTRIINLIKYAAEEGVKYHEEFEQIERSYLVKPERAIYDLKLLLKKYKNRAAYKRQNELLKKYLERPFSQYRLPITEILFMIKQNSQFIHNEDPYDQQNLADMAFVHLHLGENAEALELFKSVFRNPNTSSVTIKQLISWVETQYLGENNQPPTAEWLGQQLIDNYPTNHESHLHFIDVLWDYNRNYWDEEVANWLLLVFDSWEQDNQNKLAENVIELFSNFGVRDIKAAISKLESIKSNKIYSLCEDVFGHAVNMENVRNEVGFYAEGLLSLSKFIFEEKHFEELSEDDNNRYYSLLENFLLMLLDDPVPGAITWGCGLLAKLRTTDVDKIQNILNEIQDHQPKAWRSAFESFFEYLRQTQPERLQHLVSNNQSHLLNILEPLSLIEISNILNEQPNVSSLSNVLYSKAVEKMFGGVISNKDLSIPEAIIETLKKSGTETHVWEPLEKRYKELIIEFAKMPKVWDGKRISIMGGKPERENSYKQKLENAFGGSYKWYHPSKENELHSLANSIKSGGVDILIYITGWGSHSPKNIVMPVIESQSNYKKISHYVVPTDKVGSDEVRDFINEELKRKE